MANRHARRLREQQATERLARERQALHRSKSAQRSLRKTQVARASFSTEAGKVLGILLRRRSVARCMMRSPGFFLVLQQFFESGGPVRRLETWRPPRSAEAGRIFRSLARHAMLRYAMPEPLLRSIEAVLAVGEHPEARTISWFVLVARGGNLSKAEGLPFDFTKRAAHFFLHAPHDMPLLAALRWAQLRAMHIQERLAEPLAVLLAQEEPDYEAVWMDLFRFLLRHDVHIAQHELSRIVAFLRHQRVENAVLTVSNCYTLPVEPLYPGFQINQATPASLRMRMDIWDQHLQNLARTIRWRKFPKAPIATQFETVVENCRFQVHRLGNIEELLQEGVAMQHCVGNYGRDCSTNELSIWSLRRVDKIGNVRREATIELSDDLRIVQVKAKANQQPAADALLAVRQWARAYGLTYEGWHG